LNAFQNVDQAHHRRECGHDEAYSQQSQRRAGIKVVRGFSERQIGQQCQHETGDRKKESATDERGDRQSEPLILG
jgi:hypothetical protein